LVNPKNINKPVVNTTEIIELNFTNLLNSIVARTRKIPKSNMTDCEEYIIHAISSNTYTAPEIARTSVEFIL